MKYTKLKIVPMGNIPQDSLIFINDDNGHAFGEIDPVSELDAMLYQTYQMLVSQGIFELNADVSIGGPVDSITKYDLRFLLKIKYLYVLPRSDLPISYKWIRNPDFLFNSLALLVLYGMGSVFAGMNGGLYGVECPLCGHDNICKERHADRGYEYLVPEYCQNIDCISHQMMAMINSTYSLNGKDFNPSISSLHPYTREEGQRGKNQFMAQMSKVEV